MFHCVTFRVQIQLHQLRSTCYMVTKSIWGPKRQIWMYMKYKMQYSKISSAHTIIILCAQEFYTKKYHLIGHRREMNDVTNAVNSRNVKISMSKTQPWFQKNPPPLIWKSFISNQSIIFGTFSLNQNNNQWIYSVCVSHNVTYTV